MPDAVVAVVAGGGFGAGARTGAVGAGPTFGAVVAVGTRGPRASGSGRSEPGFGPTLWLAPTGGGPLPLREAGSVMRAVGVVDDPVVAVVDEEDVDDEVGAVVVAGVEVVAVVGLVVTAADRGSGAVVDDVDLEDPGVVVDVGVLDDVSECLRVEVVVPARC